MLDKFVTYSEVEGSRWVTVLLIGWAIIYVLQSFLAFGTAYRCTKYGSDNGVGLFIYLIGFGFAALIPGLGLHYYIKHLSPKVIIQQQAQPQIIRVVQPPQQQPQDVTVRAEMQQSRYDNAQGQYIAQQEQVNNQQNQFAEQPYNNNNNPNRQ